jgi:peptidoglycan/LPS O-acetylase OafA/YrhL
MTALPAPVSPREAMDMTNTPDSGPERQGFGYQPAFDGIRAIAVLVVIGFHLGLSFVLAGDLGVDVFFVLSGFLITSLLIQEHERTGGLNFGNFYTRRILRLYPALVAVVAACGLYALVQHSSSRSDTLRGVPTALLYMTDWTRGLGLWHSGLLEHTWSLAIEEQFYLIWPLILLIALSQRRHSYRVAAVIAGTLAAAASADRIYLWASGMPAVRYSNTLDVRVDVLMVGCALAIGVASGRLGPESTGAAVARVAAGPCLIAVLVVMMARPFTGGISAIGLPIFAVLAAVVILGTHAGPTTVVARILGTRLLVHIGRISYGLYLWHYPIILVLEPHLAHRVPRPIMIVLLMTLSLAAAEASFWLWERRFLQIRRRFEPPVIRHDAPGL